MKKFDQMLAEIERDADDHRRKLDADLKSLDEKIAREGKQAELKDKENRQWHKDFDARVAPEVGLTQPLWVRDIKPDGHLVAPSKVTQANVDLWTELTRRMVALVFTGEKNETDADDERKDDYVASVRHQVLSKRKFESRKRTEKGKVLERWRKKSTGEKVFRDRWAEFESSIQDVLHTATVITVQDAERGKAWAERKLDYLETSLRTFLSETKPDANQLIAIAMFENLAAKTREDLAMYDRIIELRGTLP